MYNLDLLQNAIVIRAIEDYKDGYKSLMKKLGCIPELEDFTVYGDAERLCDKLYGPSLYLKDRQKTWHRTLWYCASCERYYYKGILATYQREKLKLMLDAKRFFFSKWFKVLTDDKYDPEELVKRLDQMAEDELKEAKKRRSGVLNVRVD